MTRSLPMVFVPILLTVLFWTAAAGGSPPSYQLTPDPSVDADWTDIPTFEIDPTGGRVVYEADPSTDGAHQILSVPLTGGAIAEISHAAATGNVQEFAISGDAARVVYRASNLLHSTLIVGGGNLLLSESETPCWDVSPVGSMVAYRAQGPNPPYPTDAWIYGVNANGGESTIIGGYWDFYHPAAGCPAASPAGQWLTYGRFEGGEISSLRLATWDEWVENNEPSVASRFGTPPFARFTPDDVWLVANVNDWGLTSYNTATGEGGATAPPTGWTYGPHVTPVPVEGAYRVIYGDWASVRDLYAEPIHFDGPTTTLRESVTGPHWVQFSPDGMLVVFGDDSDLFTVPTLGGEARPLVVAPGDVREFLLAPDGLHVVYRADELQPGVIELFVVDIDGGPSQRISADLPAFGDVDGFEISSDSSTVVYRADALEDESFRLFSVALTGGEVQQIGDDIVGERPRTVRDDMRITPGDSHVVYRTGVVNLPDNPAEVLFSVSLDRDGDETLDPVDCAVDDATVWSLPGGVADLTLAPKAGEPGTTTLSWTPPAEPGGQNVLYDVLRTESADGFTTPGDVTCVSQGDATPSAEDAAIPDNVFYYLARAVNACGDGSVGEERPAANAHACQ